MLPKSGLWLYCKGMNGGLICTYLLQIDCRFIHWPVALPSPESLSLSESRFAKKATLGFVEYASWHYALAP